jgi:hypothetical protein
MASLHVIDEEFASRTAGASDEKGPDLPPRFRKAPLLCNLQSYPISHFQALIFIIL